MPALLPIIADSRAEYGMADRGVDLLEPADEALFETYKRQTLLTEFEQEEIYLAVSELRWLER